MDEPEPELTSPVDPLPPVDPAPAAAPALEEFPDVAPMLVVPLPALPSPDELLPVLEPAPRLDEPLPELAPKVEPPVDDEVAMDDPLELVVLFDEDPTELALVVALDAPLDAELAEADPDRPAVAAAMLPELAWIETGTKQAWQQQANATASRRSIQAP